MFLDRNINSSPTKAAMDLVVASISESNATDQTVLVYPPTQEPSFARLVITMYLIVCLTVGICGNFSQLALQYYSFRLRIFQSNVSPNCTQLYIAFLHVIYFCIATSLPSVIIENLVNIWMFGIFTCASYLVLSFIGRTAAAWITLMLFIDQKVALKQIKPYCDNQRRFYYQSLMFVAIVCVISACPNLFYINLKQHVLHKEKITRTENNFSSTVDLHIQTYRCAAKVPQSLQNPFYITNFVIDFVIPFTLMIVIFFQNLRKSSATPDSVVYGEKIRNYRLLVGVLYFIAYVPHWIAVLWITFGDDPDEKYVHIIADAETLFTYTLPAIIWLPLNILSAAVSAQVRFYDNTLVKNATEDIPLNENKHPRHAVRWSISDFPRHAHHIPRPSFMHFSKLRGNNNAKSVKVRLEHNKNNPE